MNIHQPSARERAIGALMGAFIGDALALGPHWYYDLAEMRRDYGPWVSGYTAPKDGRYHAGLKAGDLSQAGLLLRLTVESIVATNGYDEADFTTRMDRDFLPLLDGKPMSGPGGYTSQSIRETWRRRVEQGRPWGETAGHADTTEAIERTLALGIRYAFDLPRMAESVSRNTALTQADDTVQSMTVAYNAVLAMLLRGNALDVDLSDKLMDLVKSGELPFHAVTSEKLGPPKAGSDDPPRVGRFASPDALLSPSYMAEAAIDPGIQIEPAWKVSIVYGMPCAIYHQLPAAYYLAARFKTEFELAVLHAVNGGGQNQARAILTGALAGAQSGIGGIPQRFIDGLTEGKALLGLTGRLADAAV